MNRVYIDEECKMCTSYGKWISSKNLNIDLKAQINLTPEEIELDTLVYEKDGSKYYYSDAVIQSISDIGGVYNLVKIIKPKKTILTNLHSSVDYTKLKKNLPGRKEEKNY